MPKVKKTKEDNIISRSEPYRNAEGKLVRKVKRKRTTNKASKQSDVNRLIEDSVQKKTENLPYILSGEYADVIPELQNQEVQRQRTIDNIINNSSSPEEAYNKQSDVNRLIEDSVQKKTENLPYILSGEYADVIPELQNQEVQRQGTIVDNIINNSSSPEEAYNNVNEFLERQPRYKNQTEMVKDGYDALKGVWDNIKRYGKYAKYGAGAAGVAAGLYGLYKLIKFIRSKVAPVPVQQQLPAPAQAPPAQAPPAQAPTRQPVVRNRKGKIISRRRK